MRLAFVLAVLLALAVGASVALGHDHQPPRAELRGGGDARALNYWTYGWAHAAGEGSCVSVVADGIREYKPRLVVAHLHSRPRVYFRKDQRPRRVSLRQYGRLRNGFPVGDGRGVDVRLIPRRRGGTVIGWGVRFRASVPERRFYDMEASWRDEEGCGGGQSVATSFRLVRK